MGPVGARTPFFEHLPEQSHLVADLRAEASVNDSHPISLFFVGISMVRVVVRLSPEGRDIAKNLAESLNNLGAIFVSSKAVI